jgi:hypothetical protein
MTGAEAPVLFLKTEEILVTTTDVDLVESSTSTSASQQLTVPPTVVITG